MKFFKVKGLKNVMNNIQKRMDDMQLKISTEGMIQTSILVQRSTENSYPKTPVDFGLLRSSYFTFIKNSKGATTSLPSGFSYSDKPKARDIQQQNANLSALKSAADAQSTPGMFFGFSANYANIVHQRKDPSINWQRPASGPRFFIEHILKQKKEILKALKNSAL